MHKCVIMQYLYTDMLNDYTCNNKYNVKQIHNWNLLNMKILYKLTVEMLFIINVFFISDVLRRHEYVPSMSDIRVSHLFSGFLPEILYICNWRIDNLFVGPPEMTLCLKKQGIYILRHDVPRHFGPVKRLNLLCMAGYAHLPWLT